MARAFRFVLRRDLVIVPAVLGLATEKADYPAAFLRLAREMDFRRAFAVAVSFAARFWPVADLSVVVGFFDLFGLCRSRICSVTADFVPASDPFDPAGFGSGAVAAAVAAAVADPAGLSAADLSVVVAVGPDSVGSAVFDADLACFVCSACSVAVGSEKGRVVAAVFCFLALRSSF